MKRENEKGQLMIVHISNESDVDIECTKLIQFYFTIHDESI